MASQYYKANYKQAHNSCHQINAVEREYTVNNDLTLNDA